MAQLGESDTIVLKRDSSDVLVCLPKNKKWLLLILYLLHHHSLNTSVVQSSPCQSAE